MITEADTCRKYVLPKLYDAGWNDDQISEQKSFTDGRIIVIGSKPRRRPAKRADYLLRYARDFMLAVVEAKPSYKLAGDGLQQAKDYAEVLGIKFAYSTNGQGIKNYGIAIEAPRASPMKKQRINCSRRPTQSSVRDSVIIRKSP